MRFLMILLIALLSSCSSEQTPDQNTTQVTVNFGSSLASGALLPSGQVPSNVASITVQAFSAPNNPSSSPIAMQAPNFSATLIVPNGNSIHFKAKAYDANGRIVYEGVSAPYNLTGTPQTVFITLSLSITLQATQTSVPRSANVSITGFIAGTTPTTTSPLVWTATGGVVTIVPSSNGGQVSWRAPTTLGTYAISAKIDPILNPDQNSNISGAVTINVINRSPVLTTNQATVTLLEGTSDATTILSATDADNDTVTLSLDPSATPANPIWATFDAVTGTLTVTPPTGAVGVFPIVILADDGFGGLTRRTINITVNPDTIAPVITLITPLPNPVIITPGTAYTDPGSVVTDNVSVGLVATVTSTLDTAIAGTYTLTYNAIDAAGNAAIPVIRTVIVNNAPVAGRASVSFQQGINGYVGTQDTELRMDTPIENYGTHQSSSIDGTTSPAGAGQDTYMLLQFDAIFGASPTQIPLTATINTASLQMYMPSGGNDVDMHQILTPWQQNTATWNSHATSVDSGTLLRTLIGRPVIGSPLDVSFSSPVFDVTTELQNWTGGATNFGWGFRPTNLTSIDGVTFATSEDLTTTNRPLLTIDYVSSQRAVKTAANTNVTITLGGIDADIQPLSAKVTALPASGSLHQTTDGVTLGAAITIVPTVVSNASGQVIFVPTPAFSGQTAFSYKVNDGVEDSLAPAFVTVHVDNVSPVITRTGAANVSVLLNAVYVDAGATAADTVDGNITANIITNNPVNTAVAGLYTVAYNVSDAAGNIAAIVTRTVKVNAAPVAGVTTFTFQQGFNGYTSGQDTSLRESLPTTNFNTSTRISSDGGVGLHQIGLLKFGNIFGVTQNQIPSGSAILDASLRLRVSSGGNHVDVRQMQTPWVDNLATWSTHSAAVTASPTLRRWVGRPIAGSPLDITGAIQVFDVNTELQSWSLGAPNHGWGFIPFHTEATDGVDFSSNEYTTNLSSRPELTVTFQNPATTVSTPINTNITLTLGGYDANGDALIAKVTTLPLAGVLYDTADGITLGAPITVVPSTVSNANQQVIFVPATNAVGAPYATFDYVVNDGAIDSAPATVTINVTAPTGTTHVWTGTTSTTWNVATNWDVGTVPIAASIVFIPSAPVNQPSIAATTSIAGLVNAVGSTLSINGNNITLTVANGFTNAGTIDLLGLNNFSRQLTITTGSLNNTGTLLFTASGGLISAPIINSGTISAANTSATIIGAVTNTGTISLAPIATSFTINGVFDTVAGTVNIPAGATLRSEGTSTLINATGSLFTGTGTLRFGVGHILTLAGNVAHPFGTGGIQFATPSSITINGTGSLTNNGSLTLNGGSIAVPLVNNGTVNVLNNMTFSSALTQNVGSTLSINGNNITLTVANGFTNAGTIDLLGSAGFSRQLAITTGTLNNTGTLSFTASGGSISAPIINSGTLTVNGNTTLSRLFTSPAGISTINGNGSTLTLAGGVNVDGMTVDNVILAIQTIAPTLFDNVTFQNYLSTATPLLLNYNGTAQTFNNLNYNTPLTTGFHIGGTGANNNITIASTNIIGTTAPSLVAAGTVVNWPAVAVATTISAANANNTPCGVTWAVAGSPYLVASNVSIASGCRLQIDPGVVVKFNSGLALTTNLGGILDIYGQAGTPVIFTSAKDDTIGGDSNGDGGATLPAPGNWSSINFNQGSGTVSFAEVRYSFEGINMQGASPALNDITIKESFYSGLTLGAFSGQTTSPTVINLTIIDQGINDPFGISIESTVGTGVLNPLFTNVFIDNGNSWSPSIEIKNFGGGGSVTPIFNGANTITTVGNTNESILVTGAGSNPTLNAFTVTGGIHGLSLIAGATGSYNNINITGNGIMTSAVAFEGGSAPSLFTNITLDNAEVPYSIKGQALPAITTNYAGGGISFGANIVDVYSVPTLGVFSQVNTILPADPLAVGSSAYHVTGAISVSTGSRLQIDPYTVMKFNPSTSMIVQAGGTLDIYGAPNAPVIMTTVNDDTVAPVLTTSTGVPVIGSWSGIQYQASSLGSISDAQVHYANNALDITAASPTVTNFTATEFAGIGLYLRTFAANQTVSPAVTNIVLTTSDTLNQPIFMSASATDATQTVAPVINGTSITTASTNTAFGAIHLSGVGVNPTISNMTINGGGYNLYASNNASGVFTNNTFNGAASEAVYLFNNANGIISINSTNIITNAPAPYAMNQAFPSVDIYASIGVGVIDTYSVHLGGNFNATNSILTPDPLNTGASAYLVSGSIVVNNGARLQIDPYTVMKFNPSTSMIVQAGATLDIYGSPASPVIMTTVNDDTVAPILATSTGVPVIGSWSGIQYQASSLGSISDAQVHYANNALEMTSASPAITNFTATEFAGIGLYLRTFAANQTVSPAVTNIVLTTSDTFNYPMYMTSSTTDATQIIAPVINGTSITTASTNTSAGAIHLSGVGVNPTISNMTINGGGYNLYAINNASGVFTNNTFNGAASAAIYLANGSLPVIDATNTAQNTPAAYVLIDQLLPATVTPLLGVNGIGVADPYSLRVTGTLPASGIDYIMNPDPLGIGNSVYQVIGTLNVASGARLVINPGTVIKAVANTLNVNSGGTLDIYGSLGQPVYFTSINDDTIAGDTNLDGVTTTPVMQEGLSLNYQTGSLGSISFFDMRYSNNFTISSAIPMNDVSRFKGGFGMKFAGTMNQSVSNLHIDHDGIGGDTALYISGIGTNPVFTGVNTVDKYSATHEGVIIRTGANPTFQNFTIDNHGTNQPALAIYDAATVATVQNNIIQNADEAVLIANGASPIINNNVIRNSNTGVYLALWFNPVAGQAGNPIITNNRIVGNNTGIYVHNTASAIIAHNLIRTNANIGIAVDALQTAPGLALNNNLIIENNIGVQMLDDLGTQTGANALLQSNTIADNSVTGLTIDLYATATLQDNIIANNTTNFAVLSANLTGDYNLTNDVIFPTAGPNITGQSPLLSSSWYLDTVAVPSPAINASLNRNAVGVGYLTLNPYAQPTLPDINQLDIGYHHNTPDVTPSINPVTSTITTDTLAPGLNGTVNITITPKDSLGNVLGSGLQILAPITVGGSTSGTVSLAKDLGDGTYLVIFTASGVTGGSDTVSIAVNGIAIGTTAAITW